MTGQVAIRLLFYARVEHSVLLRFAQTLWRIGSAGLLPRPLPPNSGCLVADCQSQLSAPASHAQRSDKPGCLPHILFCRVMLLPVCEALGVVGCKKQDTVYGLCKQRPLQDIVPFDSFMCCAPFQSQAVVQPSKPSWHSSTPSLILPCLALSSIRHTSIVTQATCRLQLVLEPAVCGCMRGHHPGVMESCITALLSWIAQ